MATISPWNPFGVALEITATSGTVTRTSATAFTVVLNVSWETYYSGANTYYGMDAISGGVTHRVTNYSSSGNSSGSGTFTGTYSISGNGSSTKTITVTFKNFNYNGANKTQNINLSVSVPAWTSYTIKYNANGGSGAPSSQTKWKDQTLTLSSTKPTRTGYSFQGWALTSNGSVYYQPGGSCGKNENLTLYAVWKANTYPVKYNANGGSGVPSDQTKTYGVTLKLSSTIPIRTNYKFLGWGASSSSTTVSYASGANYTANAAITLYAVWVLDYVKPRITNLSIERCDSNGIPKSDGTNAIINFSWACDRTISSIAISYKLSTTDTYSSSGTISASGTSGTVSSVIKNDSNIAIEFETMASYDIKIVVTDSVDSTTLERLLSSLRFTIHGKYGGNGVAFGKTAELDDTADFNYRIRARKGIAIDNEWVLLTLDEAFKQYNDNDNYIPKYKVLGSMVTVIGVVSPINEFTSSTTDVTIASGIPSEYRPKIPQVFVCQGSGINRWACTIHTDGRIAISRYGTNSYQNVPTTAWLTFSCTYQF